MSSTPQPTQPANTANGADCTPAAVFYLEVCRGATRFPRRPVPIGRFLIGAGVQCDLRLGGAKMPLLHTILQVDSRNALLEATSSVPPLTVNGEQKESARLQDGDIIAIGDIEFEVQKANVEKDKVTKPALAMIDTESNEDSMEHLSDLSAAELVELIESEERQIAQFESRRQLGAEALLQAALDRFAADVSLEETAGEVESHSNLSADEPAAADDALPLPLRIADPDAEETDRVNEDLELIISRLDSFSEQMEQRSARLAQREAAYIEASAELLKSQQRLSTHLDLLQKQIETVESEHANTLRRSA